MKRGFLILMILLVSFSGFAKKKRAKKQAALNGTYTLVSCKEDGKMQSRNFESSEIVFKMKEKTVSIYLGCNRIQGSYEVQNNNFVKAKIVNSTRMACPDNTENVFKDNFSSVTHYKVRGEILELYARKELVLVLNKSKVKVQNSPNLNIQGAYKLKSHFDGNRMAIGDYTKTKIVITENNISCNVGCNSISGDFKRDGDKITPLQLMMTEMFCEKVDKLERQFVENLKKANHFKMKNEILSFYENEKLLMTMKKEDL